MSAVRGLSPAEVNSILVILPTWVGDMVMATPALRTLRTHFSKARITFLLNPNLVDLVRGGDWMDECIETGPNAWATIRTLRARRFDLAVLLPNSFRAAWIARWSGARRRVGYARDGRSWLLTDRIPVRNLRGKRLTFAGARSAEPVRVGSELPVTLGRFEPMPLVEYYADLVEAVGCPRPDHRLELFTASDCDASVGRRVRELRSNSTGPLVVVSPGAKFGAAKCWPAERFAALATRLIAERNADMMVTCGPGEEAIARKIGEHLSDPVARGKCHIFDAPLLTLGELKSLIRRADLLVCNDAGPRHIAKAFGIPVVTVFGPTHPDWTWTDYPGERVVRIDVDCGPCQQRLCPFGHHQCMTGVSVEAVYDAAVSLLSQPAPAHAR